MTDAKEETAESPQPDMTYTKELRKATKDVHNMTDVLVNAKFAIALSDDAVWADALLCFYEIYKFLEENLPKDLLPLELRRTREFEKDLEFLLGEDWLTEYEPRPSVRKYLEHLEEVRAKDKMLLFAYAFQMYMALMSGGQLLQKKRMIRRKLWSRKEDNVEQNTHTVKAPAEEDEDTVLRPAENGDLEGRPMPEQVNICPPGCAATYFPEKIVVLKAKLRNILNKHYAAFDAETREAFIQESRNVFIYNADVIRSVRGVNRANIRKLAVVLVFVMGVYFALKWARQ